MSISDQVVAAIRTGSATLATAIIVWLVGHGFDLDPKLATGLAAVLFAVAVAGYNLAVNLLAEHVWAGFGVLLGVPKTPTYGGDSGAGGTVDEVEPH